MVDVSGSVDVVMAGGSFREMRWSFGFGEIVGQGSGGPLPPAKSKRVRKGLKTKGWIFGECKRVKGKRGLQSTVEC